MKLAERIAAARTDLDGSFADVERPAAARVPVMSRRRRALRLGGGALAAVLVAVGVAAAVQKDSGSDETVILKPPETTTNAAEPRVISARLDLDRTTVEPGGTIEGVLVLTNNKGAPVRFGEECATKWVVVLTNKSVPAAPAFESDCQTPTEIAVGRSELAFSTLPATYVQCSSDSTPPCLPDGGPPPLPAGEYEARFVSSDAAPFAPPAVRVSVTQKTSGPFTTSTTVTAPPPTAPTPTAPPPNTTSPAPAIPEFPPARTDVVHGGTTWAVVLAGAFVEPGVPLGSNPTLQGAVSVAARGNYTTGPTDCDEGAAGALGIDPNAVGFYTVSVYFSSEADARRADEAFAAIGSDSAVVAQVQTFCLD